MLSSALVSRNSFLYFILLLPPCSLKSKEKSVNFFAMKRIAWNKSGILFCSAVHVSQKHVHLEMKFLQAQRLALGSMC